MVPQGGCNDRLSLAQKREPKNTKSIYKSKKSSQRDTQNSQIWGNFVRYRPEIDGLRAVAVLPVILYHAGFESFGGGFIGVDVFFVISGFLITNIILKELDAGTFSLRDFYNRRARRIFPALLTVITLTTIFASVLMVPAQLKEFGQSVVASLVFSANIYFWLKVDYWGQSSEFMPLVHLWSLGVEEQFYLLTPLLFLFSKRKASLFFLFVGLTVASFAAMLYMYRIGEGATSFYLLPFRGWELAVGALAVPLQKRIKLHPLRDDLLAGCALLALVASVVIFDHRTAPVLIFGIPVLCSAILLLFCRSGLTARLLSTKPFVWIGLISYSLYLFHQPVLALYRISLPTPLNFSEAVVGIGLSFILATLTYKFIEVPCRRRSAGAQLNIYPALGAVLGTLLIAGFVLHSSSGLSKLKYAMMDERLKAVFIVYDAEVASREHMIDAVSTGTDLPFEQGDFTKILFVGDSLSGDLYAAATNSNDAKMAVRRIILDEVCVRTEGNSGANHEGGSCREGLDKFLGSTVLKQADVIVVANAWLSDADQLSKFLDYPQLSEKQIIVYKSHAFLNIKSVIMNLERFNFDPTSKDLEKFSYINRHQRTLNANSILQKIADSHDLETISSFDFFCDDISHSCRLFSRSGKPLLIDQAHLSGTGLTEFQSWFNAQLGNKIAGHLR